MIKTLFWVVLKTNRTKLEGEIEKTFQCNLKMKILVEHFYLGLYNNF